MYKREQCYRNRTLLHQIATSLVLPKDICLWPPVYKLEPYEIPQVVAQIPPPPIECLLEKL